MIISLTREEDKKTLDDVGSILEKTINIYERTQDTRYIEHIERLNNFFDWLKNKIDGDYTEEDAQRMRVDNLLKKCQSSNH